ncbi:hypothetical protein GYMLUDRAFT_36074 [Collybiopsis luxurians FD-317 M1]|nr:hypothetical protein GYMLUDRAFT_36074 [Collybiopsis luxurians FD-317 M1]
MEDRNRDREGTLLRSVKIKPFNCFCVGCYSIFSLTAADVFETSQSTRSAVVINREDGRQLV